MGAGWDGFAREAGEADFVDVAEPMGENWAGPSA